MTGQPSRVRDGAALQRVIAVEPMAQADTFRGWSAPLPSGRVYGGQLVAQALAAAYRTVTSRPAHSLHGLFLRGANADEEVVLSVTRLTDGRTYSTRRVDAYQDDRLVFTALTSFQRPEPGARHAVHLGIEVDDPERLPALTALFADSTEPMGRFWATEHTFDLRLTERLLVTVDGTTTPHRGIWFRARASLGDDPAAHQAAIAYASDFGLIHVTLLAHGREITDPGLQMASLDHAMWWHRPARADEWLVYVQGAIGSGSARGLAAGRIYTRDGVLVASVAQEGMVRHPQDAVR